MTREERKKYNAQIGKKVKEAMLEIGLKMAEKDIYVRVSKIKILKKMKRSEGSAIRYFRKNSDLHQAILKEAVKTKNIAIMAQGIVTRDLKLPRNKALKILKEYIKKYGKI